MRDSEEEDNFSSPQTASSSVLDIAAEAPLVEPASQLLAVSPNAGPVLPILFALSASHALNDTIQSLIPSIYPLLKTKYALSYFEIGIITFVFQCCGSVFQPVVGYYTDKRPQPFSLAVGMTFSLVGLMLLSQASMYGFILLAAGTIGVGSSIFHPESSRVARLASGGRYGFAQSLFQVGGNSGTALGPLLAAAIVVPFGQGSIAVFSILALIGIALLTFVGRWYTKYLAEHAAQPKKKAAAERRDLSPRQIQGAIAILLLLIFSKYFYMVSLSSYYTLYLMSKFQFSEQAAQIYLFIFLAAVAVGTLAGGPIGDRIGFKAVIWGSILGVLPFTLLLPHVGPVMTAILTVPIGLIMASAFSAIMVYAQELLPARVGLVAGLFFGFAFGIAGIGGVVLGWFADLWGIGFVYQLCAWLPAIGVITVFLPNLHRKVQASPAS